MPRACSKCSAAERRVNGRPASDCDLTGAPAVLRKYSVGLGHDRLNDSGRCLWSLEDSSGRDRLGATDWLPDSHPLR